MKNLSLKAIISIALVVALVFSFSACSAAPQAPSTAASSSAASGATVSSSAAASKPAFTGQIKIGIALPYTGGTALRGQTISKGIEYAIYLKNQAGGINGKEIVAVKEDDQSQPNQAANIASKFVSDNSILAVVGNLNSSCTLAAAPIYNDAGLVTVSPDSSSPKVTDAGPCVFRVKVTDAELARAAVKAAIDDGYKKIAILYANNDYGMGTLEQAKLQMKEAGLTPVIEDSMMEGEQKDFSTSIAKMKETGADAVLFGADYTEVSLCMKQMKDAGLKLPAYGSDNLYTNALIEVAGDACEGTFSITSYFPGDPDPKVQSYFKGFTAWSGNTDSTIIDAEGYDAAMCVIEAIEKGGESREAIKNYLTTEKYQGVIGDCTFDKNGDVHIPVKRIVIKNGKYELFTK